MSYFRSLVPAGSRVIRAKTRAGFFAALPRATHVITWFFDEAWFAKAPHLKVLATPSAGRELLPKTGPKGVTVHFGGFHGRIMAESAVGFMLAWARGFFLPELKAPWKRPEVCDKCYMLEGSQAVIVGYGKVGKAIGDKLELLGVKVAGFRRANLKDLPKAAKTADWLVMAMPGDTGTDGFLNKEIIAKLPPKCVIVNVGRGSAIDESALFDALRRGRLAGAYLDVRREEPQKRLTKVPNLILQPHSAAASPDYLRSCFRELKDERLI